MASTVIRPKKKGEEWFIAKRMLDNVENMGFWVTKITFPSYYPKSIVERFGKEYGVKSRVSSYDQRLVVNWE